MTVMMQQEETQRGKIVRIEGLTPVQVQERLGLSPPLRLDPKR
jgi:hypothetical protein